MSNIVNFPAATHRAPLHPTLAEAALPRACFALHLCDTATASLRPANPSLDLFDQATLAATRIELAIANQTNRDRRRRLFPSTH